MCGTPKMKRKGGEEKTNMTRKSNEMRFLRTRYSIDKRNIDGDNLKKKEKGNSR